MIDSLKWYILDIAAPHAIPPSDGFGVRERDEDLPVLKAFLAKGFHPNDSASGARCSHQDFPDYRRIWVKTDRFQDIAEITAMPGVTVKEVQSSGYYSVTGLIYDAGMSEEYTKLLEAGNDQVSAAYRAKACDDFNEKRWPEIESGTIQAIEKYDQGALIDNINSENGVMICLRTFSGELIEALRKLNSFVFVDEFTPDTTRIDVDATCKFMRDPLPPEWKVPSAAAAQLNA